MHAIKCQFVFAEIYTFIITFDENKELKGYTCNSRTTDTPPLSSGRYVSGEHFLSRNNPTRISVHNIIIVTHAYHIHV